MSSFKLFFCLVLLPLSLLGAEKSVNFEKFLSQHDMVWDRVPHRWEVAPFSGNGNVGFLFYQHKSDAKNVISVHAGRHDYYDHRLPFEGNELLWIYRGRLPLGRFQLTSKGEVVDSNLRLNLWNAELSGEVITTEGSYEIRGISHSLNDVIYFETKAHGGESVTVSWHAEAPISHVRQVLDNGGGPRSGAFWQQMIDAPYPMPEPPARYQSHGFLFCKQVLLEHRGEATTGWEITGEPNGTQHLLASIHHSFPEKNSQQVVTSNLQKAKATLSQGTFFKGHQDWWHRYYPQSFLTLNDAEKEAFYWIQMYKLGSSMRENGPILDLMGPWYHPTFWPMVWGDLNVQLIYWTHLTSNRISLGESLPNNVDKYAGNLAKNGPSEWTDSANVATLFPQDMDAKVRKVVPDMLVWILHNYWLHCEFAGDHARMRDGLFPVLRQAVNSYFHYLREFPVVDADGTTHIKHSWSPEYPGGRGQDINFTIGLIRWSCQTLLNINREHDLKDPLAKDWQNLLDNLVDYQIDENGLRIGKDIPFDKPHRHYSHLLPFYPLNELDMGDATNKKLLRNTLDHWLDVTLNRENKDQAMPVTGYTATGAASMYACLGDAQKAYSYLDALIKHQNVSTTTMYAEGNPVIESPLSFATSVHDMLLQSWGGKIRVFPAVPEHWADAAFQDFRTQGAFLVSAKKRAGETLFVRVKSLKGAPCVVQHGMVYPQIIINGSPSSTSSIKPDEEGFYTVQLQAGDTLEFRQKGLTENDRIIRPLHVSEDKRNAFGFSEKTSRLPGHKFYSK